MSTATKESQAEHLQLIRIEERPEMETPSLESLRDEVVGGFLYAHSRANANSNKLLEVASFSYALIELLNERGLITIEELDERKDQVHKRLAEKFAEKGMGVALTREEKETGGGSPKVEIDCEKRIPLCHAACCRLRFALTVRDVEKGNVRWNLGQPYMIRQSADGYCHHIDRESRRCGIYEDRPFVCRAYDCRKDKRIWQDFEKRIVSPELENLIARLKSNDCDGDSGER
jgi:Fe-S-cluster containining protein